MPKANHTLTLKQGLSWSIALIFVGSFLGVATFVFPLLRQTQQQYQKLKQSELQARVEQAFASLSLQDFENKLERWSENGQIKILVLSRRGELIAATPALAKEQRETRPLLQQSPNLEHQEIYRQIFDRFGPLESLHEAALTSLEFAGNKQILSLVPKADLLFLLLERDQTFALMHPSYQQALGVAICLCLVTMIGSHWLLRTHFERPLRSLQYALSAPGEADDHLKLLARRSDRLGGLATSIQKSIQSWQQKEREFAGKEEKISRDLKDIIERYAETNKSLERSNHTKDRILSIIAHDLKSPFNGLKGYSNVISENMENFSKPQLRDMVDKISIAAEEAHGLLENLLQWSLVHTGGLRVKWENISLREMFNEVFELMKVNAKVKAVRLEYELKEELWVYADRMMLATVLRNLVANAIKFTRVDEGWIICRAKVLDKTIQISVEDNGVGIAPHQIDKMFQKDGFWSEKGTKEERGTGLGLGLCREFVAMNHGKLEVESYLGRGTRFHMQWRLGQAQIANDYHADENLLKILFVDDSEDNHDLVRIYLKDYPWQLGFAHDGAEGLVAFEKETFDIVLMDLNMPNMGGIECTEKMRERELALARPRCLIIAFTSSVLEEDIDAAIGAGCDSYLIKPIKKQNLVNVINRLIKPEKQKRA